MNKRGIWISIDGLDATGKTTQVSCIVPWLIEQGITPAIAITEFSASPIGETIREILRQKRFYALNDQKTSPLADTLHLLSDMMYSYETLIAPTIGAGGIAVSDRGVLSLIAYQALRVGDRSPYIPSHNALEWTQTLVNHCLGVPDLTIFLRLSPDEIRKRVIARGEQPLSVEELEFLEKAENLMEHSVKELSRDYIIVDGQGSVEQITENISLCITKTFMKVNTE
jgi:dTMP kinase